MASLAFLQGGPAPPFAAPPANLELGKRIDTLASYAQRNGVSFVQMMAQRQGGNPEFSFLHGGPGHEYYAWALYCALNGLNVSQPPSAARPAAQPAAQPPVQAAALVQSTAGVLQSLPQEVSSGWQQVLALLNGSRDSIRQSSDWFMACAPYAAGMAELMVQLALTTSDHQKQVHLVYLANDILFKALGQRAAGTGPDGDAVAQAFAPRLGRLLRAAYGGAGQGSEAQAALLRVANFWAERGVYERLVVERLTMEMIGVGAVPAGGAGAGTAGAPSVPAPQPPHPHQAQQLPAATGQQPGGGGASWDVAAAARAAAAAIAAKIGGGGAGGPQPAAQAPPPVQQPAQHQQPWGQQQAQQAPQAGQQQPWGQVQQQAGQGWSQQPGPPQYPGQMQAAQQYPGQLPGQPGALPGPPPPSAYYAGGQAPQQAAYGAPPPGAFPAQGGWQAAHVPPHAGPHPGGFAAAPQQQPYPPFPGQPGAGHPGFHPGFGAPPPGAFPPNGAPPQAPPPQPAPPPEPEEPGFDPCSFPPGLIPKLVEDHLKTDPPYSPLSPLDIEAAGVPPPPKVDPYLKSRLDKFYAQLEDYRPGMLYSDIEVDAPRSKHFSDRGGPPGGPPPMAPPGAELPHAGLGLAHPPAAFMPLDDGSYGGPGLGTGSGGSGLGFGSAKREAWEQRQREREAGAAAASAMVPGGMLPAGDDAAGGTGGVDVFNSYRHLRSKGYHQMIVENAAKRWNPVKK